MAIKNITLYAGRGRKIISVARGILILVESIRNIVYLMLAFPK